MSSVEGCYTRQDDNFYLITFWRSHKTKISLTTEVMNKRVVIIRHFGFLFAIIGPLMSCKDQISYARHKEINRHTDTKRTHTLCSPLQHIRTYGSIIVVIVLIQLILFLLCNISRTTISALLSHCPFTPPSCTIMIKTLPATIT